MRLTGFIYLMKLRINWINEQNLVSRKIQYAFVNLFRKYQKFLKHLYELFYAPSFRLRKVIELIEAWCEE